MRHAITALALLAIIACRPTDRARSAADSTDAATAAPRDSFAVADSFSTPESVLYDSVMDVYLVSNINGSPTDRDDNGFISRVAPDGRVLELRWLDGASEGVTLNAPKGMAIKGDTLFVADIDAVRTFDRVTGQPLGERAVRGATFLNDVSVGPDGSVYVSDTGFRPDFSPSGTDAVYRLGPRGNAMPLARNTSLGQPNGLAAYAPGVLVVTWNGSAYVLGGPGRRTDLPAPPHGQLDGVFIGPGGVIVASSWADSSVLALDPGATEWRVMHSGLESPADIGFDSRRGRVLVPLFGANRVEVRPLR